jgi:DNA-binding response OmpR family regulator
LKRRLICRSWIWPVTALYLLYAGGICAVEQGLLPVCRVEIIIMQRKVLVVEDDPDQLEVIRSTLKAAGFAIGTAANGIDALVKTRSVAPDLIVLDLMLPGLNGFDICESLKQDPATASVPIIMLTGMHGQFGRFAGLEAGASEFLFKPFNPDELIAKVEELLSRASKTSDTVLKAKKK